MKNYQYDLVQKMSFVRFGGTQQELDAANILINEIEALGGRAEIEEFKISAWKFNKYSIKVNGKELDCLPFGNSGSLPEGGVDLKFRYLENAGEAVMYGIKDLSDTVVLVNEVPFDVYKALCEKKAAAILVISGKWYEGPENSDFFPRFYGPKTLGFGKIPTLLIWAKDATDMIRNKVETVHLELEQDELEATSHNVVATIPGTEITDESIVITAHYDSVQLGTGSWDNATGSATIMYIYKYFLENPPKRSLRFIWCGSEELGLKGSKAYIEAHPDLVKNEIKFCFNFDMCGTVLGPNNVVVTGGEDLKHYTEAFIKEYGLNADLRVGIHSSDSAPFADKGIPSLGLSRGSTTADIHTRYDLMFPLSAEQLVKDGDFATAFIERTANAARLPVGLGMPTDIKEQLDKYFFRDKK